MRVVMISGANRGMGLSIAEKLFQDSEICLSLGMRSPENFEFTEHLKQNQKRILLTAYDATEPQTAQRWVDATLEKFGSIDVLINNAGIYLPCSMQNYDEIALDSMWQVNAKAQIQLTHLAWEHLKKSGQGRIINMVSTAGKATRPDSFGYNLTKHAMLAFTHSVRQAGWNDGIRATAICPGWVNTDLAKNADLCSLTPEQMTQPEEVATLVQTILALPNTASVAELVVSSACGTFF